jgi:hypothetical protein
MAACLLKRTNSAVFLGAPSDTANTLLMLCKVGADWPQELPPEEKYLDHVAAPGTDVDCLPGSVCRFPHPRPNQTRLPPAIRWARLFPAREAVLQY